MENTKKLPDDDTPTDGSENAMPKFSPTKIISSPAA